MSGIVRRVERTKSDMRVDAAARVVDKGGIHVSAESGDVADVQDRLLADASCLQSISYLNKTPLHCSAYRGHFHVTELLLSCNADLSALNQFDQTPLHESALMGHIHVAQLLLSCNADVNAKDHSHFYPVHGAASKNDVEMCKLLISAKADIATRDQCDTTRHHHLSSALAPPHSSHAALQFRLGDPPRNGHSMPSTRRDCVPSQHWRTWALRSILNPERTLLLFAAHVRNKNFILLMKTHADVGICSSDA